MRFGALFALVIGLASCKQKSTSAHADTAPDAGSGGGWIERFRATDQPSACSFDQGGPFIDFGEAAERWRLRDASFVEDEEREGASWWAIDARNVRAVTALDAVDLKDGGAWALDVRVLATAAHSITVAVNDRLAGSVLVEKGPPRVVSLRVAGAALVGGNNTISLAARPLGSARGGPGHALVDWVHLHTAGVAEGHGARPSRRSMARFSERDGKSYKAFSLPDGTRMRCTMPLAPSAMTRAALAVEGPGEVEVEVRWTLAGHEGFPLARVVVKGTDAAWTRVDGGAPLVPGGTMATLEVRVVRATPGSRLLVADLSWFVRAEPAAEPGGPLDAALVVVLSHVGMTDLPTLLGAANGSSVPLSSRRFRSGALSGNSAIAAILSGKQGEAIGVLDADSRAPGAALTLPRALKSVGVRSFYATGHPLSGPAHGFMVPEWDRAFSYAPNESPTLPLEEFSAWLAEVKPRRFFALLHLRGGHAPFDLRPSEAQLLPPAGYTGTIDPMRVTSWWSRHPRGPLRMTENDLTRLDALHDSALGKQAHSLENLLANLRLSHPSALIILTTDVGYRKGYPKSYDEGVLLAHDALVAPLVALGIPRMTTDALSLRDVHATITAAFGIPSISAATGRALWLDGRQELDAVMSGRTHGLWMGDVAIEATDGVESHLCAWTTDPECRLPEATFPASIRDGFRRLETEHFEGPRGQRRSPVVVDGALETALRLWGL